MKRITMPQRTSWSLCERTSWRLTKLRNNWNFMLNLQKGVLLMSWIAVIGWSVTKDPVDMRGAELRATVSFFITSGYRDLFTLVKNPVQLDDRCDWQEFSSYGNSMDFNNDSCKWRSLEKWFGSWSVTGLVYNPE